MNRRAATFLYLALAALSAGPGAAQMRGLGSEAERNDLGAAPVASGPAHGERGRDDAPQTPPKRPPSGVPNPLWAIPIESLRATRERPLFSASRRPPPAPVAAVQAIEAPPPAPPAEPEKPQITLVGVVHGAAVDLGVFTDSTGKLLRLRIGQEDNGWIVRSIGLRETILEKDDQKVTLELPARNAEIAGSAGRTVAAMASSGAPTGLPGYPRVAGPGAAAPCDPGDDECRTP